MSRSIFTEPHFNDEAAAYAYVEARLWKDGRPCPHCGVFDRSGQLKGKSNRPGLWKCYACRKTFTVKIGTIFEASHIAMRDWLTAIHLLCSSKKGISSHQLARTLGLTVKSAWFMSHRLRLAMQVVDVPQMGGEDEIVEIDETIIGKVKGAPKDASFKNSNFRNVVLSLVQRGGAVRSFHISGSTVGALQAVITAHVDPKTAIMTDELRAYKSIGKGFASHDTVNHSKDEYVRGHVYTNTVEGFFSVFKRGMKGVYQHCSEYHLGLYLAEFDFRYSNRVRLGVNDVERADRVLAGVVGKRLTYRDGIDHD